MSKAYLGETSRIEDIVDNIESANPLKYRRFRLSSMYRKKIGASESCTIDRTSVSRFDNAEILKSGISPYEMRPILQIKA